jgi:hypothetical protein
LLPTWDNLIFKLTKSKTDKKRIMKDNRRVGEKKEIMGKK